MYYYEKDYIMRLIHGTAMVLARLLLGRQMEEEGRILVIRPPYKLPVNHIEHDPEKIQETYDIGRKTATEMLDAIKSYLNS